MTRRSSLVLACVLAGCGSSGRGPWNTEVVATDYAIDAAFALDNETVEVLMLKGSELHRGRVSPASGPRMVTDLGVIGPATARIGNEVIPGALAVHPTSGAVFVIYAGHLMRLAKDVATATELSTGWDMTVMSFSPTGDRLYLALANGEFGYVPMTGDEPGAFVSLNATATLGTICQVAPVADMLWVLPCDPQAKGLARIDASGVVTANAFWMNGYTGPMAFSATRAVVPMNLGWDVVSIDAKTKEPQARFADTPYPNVPKGETAAVNFPATRIRMSTNGTALVIAYEFGIAITTEAAPRNSGGALEPLRWCSLYPNNGRVLTLKDGTFDEGETTAELFKSMHYTTGAGHLTLNYADGTQESAAHVEVEYYMRHVGNTLTLAWDSTNAKTKVFVGTPAGVPNIAGTYSLCTDH